MSALREKLVALGLTAALVIVPAFEGKPTKNGEPVVYIDPVGIATVCFGHTGPEVKMGKRFTHAQCDEYIEKDIMIAYNATVRCFGGIQHLSPFIKSAMTSFTLNVGPGGKGVKDGFCKLKSGREPSILRNLKAGNIRAACLGLLEWRKPDLAGIHKRRKAESDLCLKGLV